MSDLHFKTITELAAMLAAGETSSVDITRAVIDRTAAVDDKVKAFLSYDIEDALAQAKASDARRAAGQARGPLDGMPVGIKDTLAVKNQPLRCASKMLKDYVSPFDATCIAKLREAGAVIYGRLNMDEFAMGRPRRIQPIKPRLIRGTLKPSPVVLPAAVLLPWQQARRLRRLAPILAAPFDSQQRFVVWLA